MSGLWFEEFEEGMVFEHAVTRTVTETDNMMFSNATMNTQPLHIDFNWASENSEFGKPLVNSIFTLGLMIGISVTDTTLGTTVGNLAMTDMNFPRPVFHGDSIRSKTTIVSKRESKSRPMNGIVVFQHEAFNQHGELVANCTRTGLMKKRPV
jgi:acyl dehydratase